MAKGRAMVWAVAGIVMVAIGVVGAAILVGLSLPRTHTASSRATVAGSPVKVWDVLIDFERHPEWRSGVSRCEALVREDGKPAWVEHSRFGVLPMVVERMEAPSLLAVRIADEKLPFGGTWTYRLEPAPGSGGTVLTITEDGEVKNPLYRFMARFLMGYHGTLDQYLRDVSRKFGTEAAPEHVKA